MKSFFEYCMLKENNVNINDIAAGMQFKPTTKQKKIYNYAQTDVNMKPFTYTVTQEPKQVVTTTSDGKETKNTAAAGDIIMSGPSGEQYVVKSAKFPKLYQGNIGGPIHPEQNPRMVALYTGNQPVMFKASWGEDMILKPGDYLVKEDEGKFYRIAKLEYEQTYNPPGR